jgi:hypothetical protein
MFIASGSTEGFELGPERYRLTSRHAAALQPQQGQRLHELPGFAARQVLLEVWSSRPELVEPLLQFARGIPGFAAESDRWHYDASALFEILLQDVESWSGSTVVLVERGEVERLPLVPAEQVWQELAPAPEPVAELDYIAFDLMDQDGVAISGLPYTLQLPGEAPAPQGRPSLALPRVAAGHVYRGGLQPGDARFALAPLAVERTTLVIQLSTEDGAGVPDQAFEVLFADGSRTRGALDGSGHAELPNVPAGDALVRFPNLSASAP